VGGGGGARCAQCVNIIDVTGAGYSLLRNRKLLGEYIAMTEEMCVEPTAALLSSTARSV